VLGGLRCKGDMGLCRSRGANSLQKGEFVGLASNSRREKRLARLLGFMGRSQAGVGTLYIQLQEKGRKDLGGRQRGEGGRIGRTAVGIAGLGGRE